MRNFLINLAVLVALIVVIFIIAPDVMRQVLGIYNGLGLLPVMVLLVILAALPAKSRRRR